MRAVIRSYLVRILAVLVLVCSLIAIAATPTSAAAAVMLTPNTGPVGQAVTVTAAGFAPTSVLAVKFDGAAISTVPATVTTTSGGSATFNVNIPAATAGLHQISVSDGINTTGALFTVQPKVVITLPATKHGPAGTSVTVAGTGFSGAGVTANVIIGGLPLVSGVVVNSLGSFTATGTVPSLPQGNQVVTAADGAGNNAVFTDIFTVATTAPIRNWAVIVGVSDYLDLNDLNYCDDDATDIYNRLTGSGWQSGNIALLTNSQATKANIQGDINWMKSNAQSQDLCLFFFSGHGDYGTDVPPIDETDGFDEYICPYNSLLTSWDNDIRDDELDAWLSSITARKVVIIDSCYSGGFIRSAKATGKIKSGVAVTEVAPELIDGFTKDVNKSGFVALTAANDNEMSREYGYPLYNGVFTYYIDQGLSGPADVNSNGVSAEEAFSYAAPRVQAFTSYAQNPQLWDGISGEVILTPYSLTINRTAGGSVVEPGLGTFAYDRGTVVGLQAVPNNGYKFVNWTGHVGTVADVYDADTTVTMNGNYVITANFGLITPPAVATNTATDVTGNSTTLNGTLYSVGSASSVQVSFEWGETIAYGNETPAQTITLPSLFSAVLSDLEPDTTYYFRAKAVGDGTAYGNPMSFKTSPMLRISLKAGWNMVSVPIIPSNNSVSAVFPGVTAIYAWDPVNKNYIVPATIEPDKGYLVAVTEDMTINVVGTTVTTWTVDINAGWNLIGSVFKDASISEPNDTPDSSVQPFACWWDPIGKHYIYTTDIEPGKAYLVAATQDGTLTVSSP